MKLVVDIMKDLDVNTGGLTVALLLNAVNIVKYVLDNARLC